MAVRIGHASIDENRRAKGGSAGDQTGKEVKISNWYNGGWDFVARAKDPAVAEKIAAAAEAGANNPNIGYDQGERNDLLTEARKVGFVLSKIIVPCETDCSAFVSVCVLAAGVDIDFSTNLPTTSNLRAKLAKTGAFDILTDNKYRTSSNYLRRGDIPCKERSHTVVALDDGPSFTSEAVEVNTPAETTEAEQNDLRSRTTYSIKLPLVQYGDSGPIVETVQALLKLANCDPGTVDGEYGAKTKAAVETFQRAHGLGVDGKVGGQTWPVLLGLG